MKNAPDPKDILDFQFKELRNLKISDGFESVPASCNLIAVDAKRGLLYTACDNKIIILKSGDTSDRDWRREHVLPDKVTRLELNCDCSFLAVTLQQPTAYIYNAASFTQQSLQLLREIKLSSAENIAVLDLRWNPCIPGALCSITSDSTVGSFNITADKTSVVLTVVEKLEKLEALCVAWSPKGKQLVIGCKNGSLLQLKPDLKVARNIAGPNPSIGSVIALLWISSFQFCAAYYDPQDSRVNVLIIDAPKGEANATFTSYEDITYGSPGVEGGGNGLRYYFDHVPEWGIIVAASSSSCEIAVLGSRDHGANWEHWLLVDSGRAELPLVHTCESYPVGLAVDRTSVNKLPWGGEGSTLPHPVPVLHALGTSGQLCSFHMINLIPEVPGICSPPTEIITTTSQPRLSLAPTEISFNLAGGITSTPRPKLDVSQERPKPATPVNLFTDTPKIPVSQPQVELNVSKPQVELNVPKPQVENVESIPKLEAIVVTSKEVSQKQGKIDIDSTICIRTYHEEWSLFEKDLKSRRAVQMVDIGSAIERNQLIEKSEAMEQFLIDLQETTASLTSDISYLKALLLQTFAWLEETKSRSLSETCINTPSHSDKDNLKELRNQMYYAQTQLEQATRALDLEWLEHINKEKCKMKVPRLEFVYQNMLRHSQIIIKEKNNIQALVKKWKSLARGDITSTLNKSMANMSLFSLTASGLNNTNGAIEQRCKTIASKNCSFSREKQSKLRNLLSRSTTKIIKAATPSPIQDRLKEMLSSLATLSPPKQVQKQKTKPKSVPKAEPMVTAPFQTARSPLASLDHIVANIGTVSAQQDTNMQNKPLTTSLASIPPQIIKIPQVDTKARAAAATLVPQTIALAQPRQNKLITSPLFLTPPAPKPVSAIPSIIKSAATSEVSPFTSTAPKISATPALPPALIPTTVTVPSVVKPFTKTDTSTFESTVVKSDVLSNAPTSTGILSIPSPTSSTGIVSAVPLQTNSPPSFSFSSLPQPSTALLPNYSTPPKASQVVAPTSSTVAKSSPVQNFSFASKPVGPAAFSFASKPISSTPSNVAQSLDLSAMGLDLQAQSNTSVENSTPATTVSNISSSGSIFGGAANAAMDKTPGTIFGNSGFSSIFSGSTTGSNPTSMFGGSESGGPTSSAMKSPIFGGGAGNPQTSIFGGSPVAPAKSVAGDSPGASTTKSEFPTSPNPQSTSVFGNISSNANSPSMFGGNSTPTLNTSALGGATSLPVQPFGAVPASPIKPATFAGSTGFDRPPDSKPSGFGSVSTSSATVSPFGGGMTGSSSQSIFGGAISSLPATPNYGSATSNPPPQSQPSLFGTVPAAAPNQSIFGGTSNVAPGTNLGAALPTASAGIPAFGQAATFGAKPEFGSMFGASKPVFGGSGFATGSFPGAPQQSMGFGNLAKSPMGVDISGMGGGSMQKIFGGSSGSSTFENLATQEGGLTFGNLAQNQAEPAPQPQPFTGKTSFQSWR